MTKRMLEEGELPSTKELKHEINWRHGLGLDIMQKIISLVVFSAERPIPRLDLVCKDFTEPFVKEMEAYYKDLMNSAPCTFAIITALEKIQEDTEIRVFDLSVREHFVINLKSKENGGWLCRNSIHPEESRIPKCLVMLDPNAIIPYRTENPIEIEDTQDFLWRINGFSEIANAHVTLDLGAVGKPGDTPQRNLYDHYAARFSYKNPDDSCHPLYNLTDVVDWSRKSTDEKDTKKNICRWENRFRINALKKVMEGKRSFESGKVNKVSAEKHAIRRLLAKYPLPGRGFLELFVRWKDIVPKAKSRTWEDLNDFWRETRDIFKLGVRTREERIEDYEKGRNLDFRKHFCHEEDFPSNEDDKERILLLQQTIERLHKEAFCTFDSYEKSY